MASKNPQFFYNLKGGEDKDGKWYLARARLFLVNTFSNDETLNISNNYEIDCNEIKTSLERLQVKVDDEIINPTEDKIIECFKEKIDYFGCAIIFIFSQGEKDHFYCSDYNKETGKGKINVWDKYYHYFSGDEKPELKDCPKVFFNEWCQENGSNEELKNKVTASFQNTAHWLVYGGQPAHIGSFSVRYFSQFLDQFAQTKDLADILTMVVNEVSKVEVGPEKYLQSMTCSSLQKKLYLLPEDKVHQFLSTYRKEFEHIDVVGNGRFGVVFRAKNIEDKVEYAVKRIQFKNESEKKKIKREIKSLAQFCQCPHTVRYNSVWFETVEFDSQSKQDAQLQIYGLIRTGAIIDFCYIQMELCHESLVNWLNNKPGRDKVESLKIFKQVIEGLCFIHKNKVVHRDLKPAKILFARAATEDLRVRIADYGLSMHLSSFTETTRGTMLYMAPEMFRGEFDAKSDIYSAGLILLELLYNCSEDHSKILNNAKRNQYPPLFESTMNFAVPTLQKMLFSNMSHRPSSEELLQILNTNPDWVEELRSAAGKREVEHPSEEEDSKLEKELQLATKNEDATSQQNEELQSATKRRRREHLSEEEDFSSKEEWQFVSACSSDQHSLQRVGRRTAVATLLWDAEERKSNWFPLRAAAFTNTGWEGRFIRQLDDDFVLGVSCTSLNAQFRAAAVRLVAVMEGAPQVWGEVAAFLQSADKWRLYFSKKKMECPNTPPIKVRVTAKWTELEHLPPTPDLWTANAARIRCSWQLRGWKSVTPTVGLWTLWSEPFGQSGTLWRMKVVNRRRGGKRKLCVSVMLQHLTASVKWSGMSWKCSLAVWNEHVGEKENKVMQDSCCGWTVVGDVELETRDPLNLVVFIQISK